MSNKNNIEQSQILDKLSATDRVMIVGFGVTGQALAEFFDSKAVSYFVYEDKYDIKKNCSGLIEQIKSVDQLGTFVEKNIKALFPSPGVSLTHPIVQMANQDSIPVLGELELASFHLKGEFIAVTGTNGKSTTVKLIDALLNDAGITASLKGNFGSPLISAVNETPTSFYVIEESSYQLELVGSLRHKVAVCLNVSDDHLDRYENKAAYAKAKENVTLNSLASDVFVYNADDAFCIKMAKRSQAKLLPFSLVNHLEEGGFTDGENMVLRLEGKEWRFPIKACSLIGMHNLENMLASLLTVLFINANEDKVQSYAQTLASVVGLPHRLQHFRVLNGVDYYDDSKATNVGAVVMALASFDRPVILIAGGRDKEGDYSPLKGLIKGKVKKLLLLGEAQHVMHSALKDSTEVELVSDVKAAVQVAAASAKEGDVVLLSPACSSFDQYPNYIERGLDFQRQVNQLS